MPLTEFLSLGQPPPQTFRHSKHERFKHQSAKQCFIPLYSIMRAHTSQSEEIIMW